YERAAIINERAECFGFAVQIDNTSAAYRDGSGVIYLFTLEPFKRAAADRDIVSAGNAIALERNNAARAGSFIQVKFSLRNCRYPGVTVSLGPAKLQDACTALL